MHEMTFTCALVPQPAVHALTMGHVTLVIDFPISAMTHDAHDSLAARGATPVQQLT